MPRKLQSLLALELLTGAMLGELPPLPRQHAHVWTNTRTGTRYTVNGVRHIYRRALERAGITTGDMVQHTLRHTALTRMSQSVDHHTLMAISGH